MSACEHCDQPTIARGLCRRHYARWRRTGTSELRVRPSLRDRFLAKVVTSDDVDACWSWTGSKCRGYGRLWIDGLGRPVQAQRVSYELHTGPIPDGLEIDHLCRTPECTNPRHLEAVTGAENLRRQAEARRERARQKESA